MLLFLLSAFMVFISSYFLASCFGIRKYLSETVYFFLIAFAQLVLTFEILSLFKAISIPGVLTVNLLFLAACIYFWVKKGKPLYKPKIKEFLLKVLGAAKKDYAMFVLLFAFLFFIAVTIFLCFISPVSSYDGQVYHVNRAVFWIFQGSLNHFDIADARNLVMPINSEILYAWNIMFFKKDFGIGFFSFFGYLLSISSLYGLLDLLGYSMRKRLWAVFMLSSVASIVIQASGVETDIITGGLVLSGVFLFALASRKNCNSAIYFSSLAFALAVGTKTPAFFTLPACLILILFFAYKYNKQNASKMLMRFFSFAVLNFILFASYNYILNLVHYHNPMGSIYVLEEHKSLHHIKAYLASFIRHIFLMFDFTGFRYSDWIQGEVLSFQDKILKFLHIPLDYNVLISNKSVLNRTLIDPFVGGGVIGLIVFMPATIISIIRVWFEKKSTKRQTQALFGIAFYICVLTMSMIIGYMVFNVRFLLTFIILSSPVLVLTYIKSNKNILKYIILFYSLSYLVLVSTNIWARNFIKLTTLLREKNTIEQIREKVLCDTGLKLSTKMPFCILNNQIRAIFPKNSRAGIISSTNDRLYLTKLLEYEGYKIDVLLAEKLEEYDLSKYDYLISTKDDIAATSTERYKEKQNTYKIDGEKLIFDAKKNPNMCKYLDFNYNIIENGKGTPIGVSCILSSKFMNEKGFKLIGYIKTKSQSTQDLQQFYFFQRIVD